MDTQDPLFDRMDDAQTEVIAFEKLLPWQTGKARASANKRSIQHVGLGGVNIVVRPKGDKYEVIDGKRTLNALQADGYAEAEMSVIAADDTGAALMGLSRNRARRPNPVDDAANLERALNAGLTLEDVAKTTGVPLGTLRTVAKLVDLPANLRDGVEAGLLSANSAVKLGKLSPEARAEADGKLNRGERVTGSEVDALSRVKRSQAALDLPPPPPPAQPNPLDVFRLACDNALAEGLSVEDLIGVVEGLGHAKAA